MTTETEEVVEVKHNYDDDFQKKVLALNFFDNNFGERVDGLLEKDFFSRTSYRYILSIIQNHYKKYNTNPSKVALTTQFRNDIKSGILRAEQVSDIKELIIELAKTDISDREYIIDCVATFVRRQATINAIQKSVSIIEKGDDIDTILPIVQKAIDVGTTDLATSYDYNDNIEQRLEIRKARLSGELAYNSVTTGFLAFDECLKQRGWGKGELSIYMAPAKAGKSVALMDHAIKAVEKGHNVLFVTLEVSSDIQADRMDSNVSGVPFSDLDVTIDKVGERVKKWREKVTGILKMHEFPSGTYRVSDLRRLVKKYKATGITFDMVVLDYADIMLSDASYSDNEIGKSKQIFIDLRALAQLENLAILTAIQTNRKGAEVERIDATHVAEDFNKIRTADLVISINANELEKAANEARLFFAASRNQASVTLVVERDLSCMKHIKSIKTIKK